MKLNVQNSLWEVRKGHHTAAHCTFWSSQQEQLIATLRFSLINMERLSALGLVWAPLRECV
jgi:hypothetical protein